MPSQTWIEQNIRGVPVASGLLHMNTARPGGDSIRTREASKTCRLCGDSIAIELKQILLEYGHARIRSRKHERQRRWGTMRCVNVVEE